MIDLLTFDPSMQLLVLGCILAIWAVFTCMVYAHLPHRYIGKLGEGIIAGILGFIMTFTVIGLLVRFLG